MAHWLRDRGFEAYAVTGGVHALLGAPPPEAPAEKRDRSRDWKAGASALRHRHFQIYFGGVLLSLAGSWVEAGAFGYVVLLLGGSAATLGIIGFLNTIPNLVFALPAGVLADHFDRRKLLLLFQGGNMGVAVALTVLWAWFVEFCAPCTVVALTRRVSAARCESSCPCCCASVRSAGPSSIVASTVPAVTRWPT